MALAPSGGVHATESKLVSSSAQYNIYLAMLSRREPLNAK
jgi:hypothetical protein